MIRAATPEQIAVLKSALRALEAASIAGQPLYGSKVVADLRTLIVQVAA